jgi:hypothetical protein
MIYLGDKCILRPALGDDCDVLGVPCVEPYYCNPQHRKCAPSETLGRPCAWSSQYLDNCTTLNHESCTCEGSHSKCQIVKPSKIITDKLPEADQCINFTSRNSPIFNECVKELSHLSPASSLIDVISKNLTSCKKYWANFYCCSICTGVELDELTDEDMHEKLSIYLPGLKCGQQPEWNPEFTTRNGKCVLAGYTEPKSRSWFKSNLCGGFLRSFDNSEGTSDIEAVETQGSTTPYGAEPSKDKAVGEPHFTRPPLPKLAHSLVGYGSEPAGNQGLVTPPNEQQEAQETQNLQPAGQYQGTQNLQPAGQNQGTQNEQPAGQYQPFDYNQQGVQQPYYQQGTQQPYYQQGTQQTQTAQEQQGETQSLPNSSNFENSEGYNPFASLWLILLLVPVLG